MPFLGDMMKMLQGQGPLNWDAARQWALSIASGGTSEPNVDPAARIQLEELGRIAELHVATTTGLATDVAGRSMSISPVTRTQWAQRTLDAYKPLFDRLAGSLAATPAAAASPAPTGEDDDPFAFLGSMLSMMSPMMLGIATGHMVGHLAVRSLGMYDLPVPRPGATELMVVPANIDAFGEDWSLPLDELRLWVCLDQVTRHAVLSVPHVGDRMSELLAAHAAGFRSDPGALGERLESLDLSGDPSGLGQMQQLFSDPGLWLGAVRTPEQEAMLPQLEALVAVLEGYVDHVMDTVGGRLISSYDRMTEALRRRRVESDDSDRFVERILGLDLSQAQYDRGAAFVDGVVERAGADALSRLWASPRELPTPAEVDAPGLWLARIDLPDDRG
jgi:putative hydrolase